MNERVRVFKSTNLTDLIDHLEKCKADNRTPLIVSSLESMISN